MVTRNTPENREALAQKVVDNWDMDTLVQYAIDQTVIFYASHDAKFQEDWNQEMI